MSQLLEWPLILELQKVVVQKGIPRNVLLTGILPGFVAGLEKSSNDAAQTLLDLSRLNETERLSDGSVPLRRWLENAYQHTELLSLSGCEVFKNALIKMGYPPPHKDEPAEKNKKVPPPSSIKILFLAANPAGRDQLAIGRELRLVEEALLKTPDGRRIPLVLVPAVTTADLQRVLLEHEPCILHFSGHGDPSGNLVLTSQLGGGAKVDAQALGNLLEIFKSSLRCVVLNACFSELVAEAIKEHIDCVVGMSRAISDPVAIQFAIAFYQAIAFHKDVHTAFKLARSQIDLSGLEESDIPQLLVKDGLDANTIILFPK